ncbi:MAG: FHA domain-containing protein [Myxococcales bacterium]|nr:FHA domain-containing protein [Myxococcales bacterium]
MNGVYSAGELIVCSGPATGKSFGLDHSPTSLGRSPTCDVALEDDRASSLHARIILERGQHRLVDLESTNGTFVNNRRVQEVLLSSGDLIQVGETILEYRMAAGAYVVDPVPVNHYGGQPGGMMSSAPDGTRALAFPQPYAPPQYAPPTPYGYFPMPPTPPPGEADGRRSRRDPPEGSSAAPGVPPVLVGARPIAAPRRGPRHRGLCPSPPSEEGDLRNDPQA